MCLFYFMLLFFFFTFYMYIVHMFIFIPYISATLGKPVLILTAMHTPRMHFGKNFGRWQKEKRCVTL